jgi:hypothetical protein
MTDTNPLRPALVAAAQQLGLSLSDSQIEQLLAYQGLIQKWNKVYNLTALRDPADMLTHHLLDSLTAVPSLIRSADNRIGPVSGAKIRLRRLPPPAPERQSSWVSAWKSPAQHPQSSSSGQQVLNAGPFLS